ncbi:hypothetical protein [Comamonas flocculans]|uniref:Lipoprotein n=1 Tax=Comamonas flocculans TaxID=2597701 RepID=A0A5B8RTE6_9BURK|nr:hypothetical protein [Comamonas flocculans]QEA12761.1 hypothetical protein FOZ74_06830 [Comamonas flocculans]
MHTTPLIAGVLLLALAGCAAPNDEQAQGSAHTSEPLAQQQGSKAPTFRWRTVGNGAQAGELGYGWQFFNGPGTPRAVAISPLGDYYYSRGAGPHWIAWGPLARSSSWRQQHTGLAQ